MFIFVLVVGCSGRQWSLHGPADSEFCKSDLGATGLSALAVVLWATHWGREASAVVHGRYA